MSDDVIDDERTKLEQLVEKRLHELLRGYGDASFHCGKWTLERNGPYMRSTEGGKEGPYDVLQRERVALFDALREMARDAARWRYCRDHGGVITNGEEWPSEAHDGLTVRIPPGSVKLDETTNADARTAAVDLAINTRGS